MPRYRAELTSRFSRQKGERILMRLKRLGYTTPHFWDIAAEEGVTCILGVDAHTPQQLQDPEFYDQCERFLDGLNIRRQAVPGAIRDLAAKRSV